LETLEEMASDNHIEVIDGWDFESEKIKGLYCNNVIALSKQINNTREKACILAEELGHYHTTTGIILDQNDTGNRKQEFHARMWAYDNQIGLQGLIAAYKARCMSQGDMAEYFNVTEDFLNEALDCYRKKYGIAIKVDNYVIGFEPNLYVLELFE
jgi:hypothetical protein